MAEKSYLELAFEKNKTEPVAVAHRTELAIQENMLERMETLGLDNKELAKRSKVSVAYIEQMFRGPEQDITIMFLAKVAIVLEVSISDLVKD